MIFPDTPEMQYLDYSILVVSYKSIVRIAGYSLFGYYVSHEVCREKGGTSLP